MVDLDRVMTEDEARQLAPLTLAFYGDCVYERFVRRELLLTADMPVHALHDNAVKLVCAAFQAKAARFLKPILSENELYYFNRGRNSSNIGTPKNSKTADYRAATGLETLFGYLELTGRYERAKELYKEIRQYVDTEAKK